MGLNALHDDLDNSFYFNKLEVIQGFDIPSLRSSE